MSQPALTEPRPGAALSQAAGPLPASSVRSYCDVGLNTEGDGSHNAHRTLSERGKGASPSLGLRAGPFSAILLT